MLLLEGINRAEVCRHHWWVTVGTKGSEQEEVGERRMTTADHETQKGARCGPTENKKLASVLRCHLW